MSLYPEGHPPRIPCGDVKSDERIINIAHQPSLELCLNGAAISCNISNMFLEQLRAWLFRAEQLIEAQPLPATIWVPTLPQDIAATLETLKAAQQCLEEWLESTTCKKILEKYPRPPAC